MTTSSTEKATMAANSDCKN